MANNASLLGIGDINSDAKGSGARYNATKPDMSLVPLTLLARSLHVASDKFSNQARDALFELGTYQKDQTTESPLFGILTFLGNDGWEECARVFSYGQKKYAAWNWAKGMNWSIPLACTARHLMAMTTGELCDKESGLPHRGHVYCNIVMLLTYRNNYPEGNDLPKEGLL